MGNWLSYLNNMSSTGAWPQNSNAIDMTQDNQYNQRTVISIDNYSDTKGKIYTGHNYGIDIHRSEANSDLWKTSFWLAENSSSDVNDNQYNQIDKLYAKMVSTSGNQNSDFIHTLSKSKLQYCHKQLSNT